MTYFCPVHKEKTLFRIIRPRFTVVGECIFMTGEQVQGKINLEGKKLATVFISKRVQFRKTVCSMVALVVDQTFLNIYFSLSLFWVCILAETYKHIACSLPSGQLYFYRNMIKKYIYNEVGF